MSIVRDNSRNLLAVLLIVLVGAVFIPTIWDFHFQRGDPAQKVVAQSGTQPDFMIQIEPAQFLMKNGTSADPGLVFTLLNGFVGNVTLSATVSPIKLSDPNVSFNPSTVKLNASLPGSPLYAMKVNTTNMTESGVYTITVIGSSASIIHSANATVGVTSVFVPANGADLLYRGHFTTVAYVGSSTTLNSTFEDLGYVPIGITKLTVSFSFGAFQVDQSCSPSSDPLITICISLYVHLDPYQEKTTALTIRIPSNTRAGNYSATVTVNWEPVQYLSTDGGP
jgi:hypothetical protein